MSHVIGGIVGMAGLLVFLGDYAYKVDSLPLAVIIVVVLGMAIYDFVNSVKQGSAAGGIGANDKGPETAKSRDPGTMREMDSESRDS